MISKTRQRLASARLYCLTPDWPADRLVEFVAAVVDGGADVIQLRHKSMPRGELVVVARRLRGLTAEADVLFVVNDYLDIALLAEADGVHLGPDDLPVDDARRVAGADLVIGASASTPDAARRAVAAGADYIGCGAVSATPTKPDKAAIGAATVAAVAAAVDVPVFAIGGIDSSNVAELRAAGIDRVCVLSSVAHPKDPRAAARELKEALV